MELPLPFLGDINISLWMILLPLCLILLYIYGSYPYSVWKKLGVPGPQPTLFLGNIPELFGPESSKAAFAKWQSLYGRVYGIYYFRYPALVITKPELIKEVLVKDFNNYRDRLTYDGQAMLNREVFSGVFFAQGEDWRRIRAIVTPSFSIAKIKAMTSMVNRSAKRLGEHVMEGARKGDYLDAKLLYGAFALDVVTGTGFSIDVDSVSNLDEPFTRHGRSLFIYKKSVKILTLMAAAFPSISYPILKAFNTGFFKTEDMEFFDINIRRLIDERLAEKSDAKRVDFLQLMINAIADSTEDNGKTGGTLSREEIVAQGILIFIAGYETASSTLQFLSYELARHPDVQEKIVAEIEEVIGDEDPTYDMCLNLKYTEAAINETLRMYPPLSVLTRQTDKGATTTLNGMNLPPQTGIAIPLYILGRDPEYWEDPDNFNPDRFVEGSPFSAAYDPFTFMPFGYGPRICVGMKLGLLEMKLALVHVLKRVVFTKATPEKLHINDFTSILQPSEPVMIGTKPR